MDCEWAVVICERMKPRTMGSCSLSGMLDGMFARILGIDKGLKDQVHQARYLRQAVNRTARWHIWRTAAGVVNR
jgi:hypothetical protein